MKLTEQDKALLRLLLSGGMMHTVEIAQALGITEDEVTKGMLRLQEAGLVHFTPDSPVC